MLSRLSRTGWTTDRTRARSPSPARSNPRPRRANHWTGHLRDQQVTSVTRPATGRAQPEPTPDKRQKETGPGDRGLPGDKYHYINIHFHAHPYSNVYIYAETTIVVSDICYDNYQRIRQNWNVSLRQTNKKQKKKKIEIIYEQEHMYKTKKKRQKEYQQYKETEKKKQWNKTYINIGKVLTRARINFADVADIHSSSLCCIRLHIDLVCKLLSKMKNLVYSEYGSVPRCDPVRN